MNPRKFNINKAYIYLKKDRIISQLIQKHGELSWDWESDLFEDLIESIVSQQLSDKAAATIFKRFKALFKKDKFPAPLEILKVEDQKIREAGISFSKIKYIKGIAQAVNDKSLVLEKLHKCDDEEVVAELAKLKGVGRWTAEMILMFSLKRVDVFSVGDLGLRTAVSKLYKVDRDDFKKIEKISERWKPYRTIAARYLWKSLGE